MNSVNLYKNSKNWILRVVQKVKMGNYNTGHPAVNYPGHIVLSKDFFPFGLKIIIIARRSSLDLFIY